MVKCHQLATHPVIHPNHEEGALCVQVKVKCNSNSGSLNDADDYSILNMFKNLKGTLGQRD